VSVATVRTLLGDIPKYDRHAANGDAGSKTFAFPSGRFPVITGSVTVTVDGTTLVEPDDYTLDVETGVTTFVSPPGVGTENVVWLFKYAELSDESITAILAIESDPRTAAAICAESLAGKYAGLVDKKIGDLSISWSQRSKQWAEIAAKLRSSARSALFEPFIGGVSVSDKAARRADTDLVQPAFRRDLFDYDAQGGASDDI
jgi:hypothetical protein